MPVSTLVEAAGPFLIPVVIFVVGAIGYGILRILSERDLLS